MSQPPRKPIPVAMPAKGFAPPYPGAFPGPGGPRRRGMPAWGIVLIVLGSLVLVLGVAAALIVPAVGYSMFVANKGMCKHKVKALTTVSKSLHTLEASPIGAKWIEGFDWTAANTEFPDGMYSTAIGNDNIKKSRLAFWRMIADPAIVELNVSPGGPQAFICPGSGKPKEPARLRIDGVMQRDFPEPRKNLFYSMFNQSHPNIVPDFAALGDFIIMGDRSPQDDGYALNANSANHRWGNENTGQNICYASGNIDWVDTTTVGIDEDEIYARGKDVGTRITKSTVPLDTNDTILMPVAE